MLVSTVVGWIGALVDSAAGGALPLITQYITPSYLINDPEQGRRLGCCLNGLKVEIDLKGAI